MKRKGRIENEGAGKKNGRVHKNPHNVSHSCSNKRFTMLLPTEMTHQVDLRHNLLVSAQESHKTSERREL